MNFRTYMVTFIFVFLLQVVTAQQPTPESFKEITNIGYIAETAEKDSLQQLNLVLPDAQTKVPLLIWIGGGAWSYGDRHQEMALARKLAAHGIAVASVGHRMSPATWRDSTMNTGVQHPEHIKDIAATTRWLYDHATNYNYSIEAFFIGGYSSGAHLAALLDLDKQYLHAEGLPKDLFKGIIPVSGTYDIVDYHRAMANGSRPELAQLHVEAVFGEGESVFKEASPVQYLENLKTPILLISDTNIYNYTRLFEDRIRETDFRNMQSVYVHHLSHGELWKEMSFADKSVYRELIVDFINKLSTFSKKE
ncbi:alpha/beta hydrolase [Flavobacteriaceae bacterium M23B6Z8]